MRILLVDGQGGKLGKMLAESILSKLPDIQLVAVGTNGAATAAMMKGGANMVATGENAVIVNSRTADIIVGPIGMVIADSMLGEITPAMAIAVAQSSAVKILIPSNKCRNMIAGIGGISVSEMVDDALLKIADVVEGKIKLC